MRILQFAAIALALISGGCVVSTTPLLAPDARVVPFPARIAVQAYERESATAPWKPNGEEVELVADANKIVREADATGKPDDDEYAFHADRAQPLSHAGPLRPQPLRVRGT